MEAVGIILFILFVIFLVNGNKDNKSTARNTGSSRSQSRSAEKSGEYYGPLQLRLKKDKVKDTYDMEGIEIRGEIPVPFAMEVSIAVSIFDNTDGDQVPVISLIDAVQEDDSLCFRHDSELGSVSKGDAITKWFKVSGVIPEMVVPPYGGKRTLMVLVRFYNSKRVVKLSGGYGTSKAVFLEKAIEFTYNFSEKGYEEESEHKAEAQQLSLKVGVAVAMADGTLDESEGLVLKKWILKSLDSYPESRRAELKEMYNSALRDAYEAAENGDLVLSKITKRLREVGDRQSFYEAVDLCFDVMAADGVADSEELTVIESIAQALELDINEINKMKDQRTIGLSAGVKISNGLEGLVGIQESWSAADKKKHLRQEFQKWSNRLNSLSEGTERENAQQMLEAIATLRKKYD